MDANLISFSSDVDMAKDTRLREKVRFQTENHVSLKVSCFKKFFYQFQGNNFKYGRHLDEYERCYLELLRKKEASKAKIRLASPQVLEFFKLVPRFATAAFKCRRLPRLLCRMSTLMHRPICNWPTAWCNCYAILRLIFKKWRAYLVHCYISKCVVDTDRKKCKFFVYYVMWTFRVCDNCLATIRCTTCIIDKMKIY